jgi:hypothetical protein
MTANHSRTRRAALAAFLVLALLAALAPASVRAQDASAPFSTKWALSAWARPPRRGPTPLVAVLWLTLEEDFHAYANPAGRHRHAHQPAPARGRGRARRCRCSKPSRHQRAGHLRPQAHGEHLPRHRAAVRATGPGAPASAWNLRGTLALAACSDKNCWPLRAEVALYLRRLVAELPDAPVHLLVPRSIRRSPPPTPAATPWPPPRRAWRPRARPAPRPAPFEPR